MIRYLIPVLACLIFSCKPKSPPTEIPYNLSLDDANILASLPLQCINQEYPNKLSQTLGSANDLDEPKNLHPAFYGCFDWHSAVHGHWTLVKLLKTQTDLDSSKVIRAKLLQNISLQNIENEVRYFDGRHNKSFERTYGWAWILKLAEELNTWDDSLARRLEYNLEPLTALIAAKYINFLPNLEYPIRVGTHTNTAFGLTFAYDFAKATGHDSLIQAIEATARKFYLEDANCPLEWEPSGYDFLSPCFEEIDLMMRVLNPDEFRQWLKKFAPQLKDPKFDLQVGQISDREDGHLVHLDGLNFSRAWVMYRLSSLEGYEHLRKVADIHFEHSFPNLLGDSYEGGHWLGSFAMYAIDQRTN
jgi:hypothetical protein